MGQSPPTPSLGNFYGYIACSPPKTPHSQGVPLGCLVISVACWVVKRVFPIILLILEDEIKWFSLIFWVFSGKTDAENLARISLPVSI